MTGAVTRGGIISILILAALILNAGCISNQVVNQEKPPAPGLLVEYTRTGGIAGFNDHLVIFSNGQAAYERKEGAGVFSLTKEDLARLKASLDAAEFSNLSPDYPAPSPGADYFSYTITYQGKTVRTETGGVPPELSPVIGQLDYLLSEYG